MPMGINMSSAKKEHQKIDWVAVGKRVRALRGSETQAEFAARVGFSQGYLSHLERGEKEIGPEILLKISQISSKTIEWLLTGRPDR